MDNCSNGRVVPGELSGGIGKVDELKNNNSNRRIVIIFIVRNKVFINIIIIITILTIVGGDSRSFLGA